MVTLLTTISISDILLALLAASLIVLGLIGCILPVIPGPPLSWAGILVLHFTPYAQFSTSFLIVWAIIAVFTIVLDYVLPVSLTQKLGGTKAGLRGSTIGMILGLFIFPPIGLIIGPIIGAFVGELIAKQSNETAFRSALGSLLGFLITTGFKLMVSGYLLFVFIKELFF